jgi:hypothetical protein
MERAGRRGRGRGRGVSSHHSNPDAGSDPSRTPPGSAGPRGDELGLAGPGVEPPVEPGDPAVTEAVALLMFRRGIVVGGVAAAAAASSSAQRATAGAVAATMSINTDRSTMAVVAGQDTEWDRCVSEVTSAAAATRGAARAWMAVLAELGHARITCSE